MRTGPAASFAGIRRVLAALRDAGARFAESRARNDVAWPVLFPDPAGSPTLAGVAISASERRLHRESEQTFRVLALAASAELGTALLDQGEPAEAERHYARAEEAASRLGDPYRIAMTRAGRAATTGGGVGEDTLTLAKASRTQAARSAVLAEAMTGPAPHERVRALLPRPRTRLDRPFDLVDF